MCYVEVWFHTNSTLQPDSRPLGIHITHYLSFAIACYMASTVKWIHRPFPNNTILPWYVMFECTHYNLLSYTQTGRRVTQHIHLQRWMCYILSMTTHITQLEKDLIKLSDITTSPEVMISVLASNQKDIMKALIATMKALEERESSSKNWMVTGPR